MNALRPDCFSPTESATEGSLGHIKRLADTQQLAMAPSTMKAVVKTETGKVEVKLIKVPQPGSGQVLVKVFAAAQNPSDWMKLKDGWGEGPECVCGHDFAGVIERVGPDVSPERKAGQRVAGWVDGCWSVEDGGAFAEYTVVDASLLVDLPDNMSFESGSTLCFAAFTGCQALWQNQNLPTPLEPAKTSFPILVWGGASAVGQYVVQLTKLAGLQVITTASPQNHELMKKIGADAVFDYKDPEAVSKIKSFCGDRELSVAIDCASLPESVLPISQCLGDREGTYIALVMPAQIPAKHIKSDFTFVYTLLGKQTKGPYDYPAEAKHYEQGKSFAKMLSQILKENKIQANPTRVVPNGLADAQFWFDYQEQGKVRAHRIVYSIDESSS
ncbi:hypothetical protein D9757_013971 [Collybiopsis confluens]|uniref:Enoyl reductase (ER) domain-containing protein n=1 Tax=Collybiopsis confluens TaxID=2823264 RepID=A0A8H5CM70_9AGAR|nr:hypothetical protein D9757_013971 [Collybiopsis confluens]